jgi:hypothetical protein
MCAGCFSWLVSWCRLHIPWGAKKKNTEMDLPEVSANLSYSISLTHGCIQKLESRPEIVPATTLADNFMEPEADEV